MSTLEELYRTLLKSAVTGNGVPDPEPDSWDAMSWTFQSTQFRG